MGDLVIRDKSTNQSWVITPTKQGYAEASEIMNYIREKGHEVGDDNTDTISKVRDYFGY